MKNIFYTIEQGGYFSVFATVFFLSYGIGSDDMHISYCGSRWTVVSKIISESLFTCIHATVIIQTHSTCSNNAKKSREKNGADSLVL